MTYWLERISLCAVLLPSLLVMAACPAGAETLVAEGQRALLKLNITVEGNVEESKGYRDEVVKWSTKRALESVVEMVASKPEKTSTTANLSGQGAKDQQALMADIQKQSEACGQDQACQMRVAMQLMNSPVLKAAADAPLRYQVWSPLEGGKLDVTGHHQETLHTVFYTAARETTDCNMTAPKLSPELLRNEAGSEEQWNKLIQEALENSARAVVVEVDGTEKSSVLSINSVLGLGFGDIKCVQNIGSGPETSHHSTNPTLLPVGDMSIPLQVTGTAARDGVIASGSTSLNGKQTLNNLGVGFAVDMEAPLKIVVRWELKRI